jgi:branched-chain amino acid transport system permease protein
LLKPFIDRVVAWLDLPPSVGRLLPWILLTAALGVAVVAFLNWPIALWDPGVPAQSPSTYSLQMDQSIKGGPDRPLPEPAGGPGALPVMAVVLAGGLLAAGLSFLGWRRGTMGTVPIPWQRWIWPPLLLAVGLGLLLANTPVTDFLFSLNSVVIFFFAMTVTIVTGAALGGLIEVTLIRPLYDRPIYQLMLTLGLGVAGIELVQAIWGRPEFNMPKPAAFAGSGEGCPATSLADWLEHGCSTFLLVGGRLRVYNEIFIIIIGLVVLVGVWILLQRSRLGMVIRAGVQDSEMVEALGIDVRRVFTFVFALGAALATLGGIVAAPSMGLSPLMGESLLLAALIALAIGGLTSFPGAAAGSLLVGLLQQFIIKYGQIGINLPFLDEPFKPTPPLVPASTVLLMVIILLILPQGLFGRRE